jgi:hypothetical protein
MTLDEICIHEHLEMKTRRQFGYKQHDDHVWRWLNHHLKLWGEAHPIRIIMEKDNGRTPL